MYFKEPLTINTTLLKTNKQKTPATPPPAKTQAGNKNSFPQQSINTEKNTTYGMQK